MGWIPIHTCLTLTQDLSLLNHRGKKKKRKEKKENTQPQDHIGENGNTAALSVAHGRRKPDKHSGPPGRFVYNV